MANYKSIKNANAEIERLRNQVQVPKESWRSRALYVTLGFITGLLTLWSLWILVAVLAIGGLVWLFRANWTANISEARSVFDKRVSNGSHKAVNAGKRVSKTFKSWGALAYVLMVTLLGTIVGAWLGNAIWASPGWRGALLGAIIGLWSSATLAIVFVLEKEKS